MLSIVGLSSGEASRASRPGRKFSLPGSWKTSPGAENKPSSKLVRDLANDLGFLVAMRLGETPVPIPNTMVKPQAADGTMLGTAWESRWPPELKRKQLDGRHRAARRFT